MQTPKPITMDRLYELCELAKMCLHEAKIEISPKELWALVDMAKIASAFSDPKEIY